MQTSLQEYRQLLVKYLRPLRLQASLLTILLLSKIFLLLAIPQIMRLFIDTVGAGGELNDLLKISLAFLIAALIQQITSVLATYFSENIGWTATNALRNDLADHCLHLDLSFHNSHTPGEMIERVDGDVTALSNFFSQFIVQIAGNALLMVGVLVLLFKEDWRVGLGISIFSGISLFVLVRFRNIAVPHWKAERQASAELYGFLEERLAGTEDIRANGAKEYVMHHFYRLMRGLMRASLKAGLMINILLNTMWILFALGTATAFAIGAYLYRLDVITMGAVYIIFQYTTTLQRPIEEISRQMESLQKAGASVSRIRELRQFQTRVVDSLQVNKQWPAAIPNKALEVEFKSVSFGYSDDLNKGGEPQKTASSPPFDSSEQPGCEDEKELVLHDLSFRIKAGTVLGLLGRTGSGKTSLTRLLLRLYDPDQGAIYLGPVLAGENGTRPVVKLEDIRQVPLRQLRRQVSMVTQNIQLFNVSIRDNLTFFDDAITDDQVLSIIFELGLGEWYRSLPKGLDTELESGGGGLSAGEAQLLAFTRIFLKDPGLVILDEASSRLDPATEHLIERAVERLVKNRTAIIVAHRLGTVQRADEIMILEAGRIIEHGQQNALAKNPASRFSKLLQTGLEEVLV